MIAAPSVGSHVRVETKFGVYEGAVVPNEKWDKPNTFCMTGDQHISTRNIALHNVIKIEYIREALPQHSMRAFNKCTACISRAFNKCTPCISRAFRVHSKSSGKTYIVTTNGKNLSCTCLGFQYRHKCKHVEAVKRKLQ